MAAVNPDLQAKLDELQRELEVCFEKIPRFYTQLGPCTNCENRKKEKNKYIYIYIMT